jgi:creatinine amidohydrolase/Fe(II)-dependent formamide hydrolase-like protein
VFDPHSGYHQKRENPQCPKSIFDVMMPLNMEDIAPETCGYGDPTQGGPEQGKIMFERMVDSITAFVEQFRQMDTWIEKA